MTHTILNIASDGQIIGAAFVSEAQVESTVAAMEKAGQEAVVLPWQKLSVSHALLVYDREAKTIRKRSETLAELRGPLLAQLTKIHAHAAQQPLTINGHEFDADARAQATVQAFALRIRAGEKSPHGGMWRLRDNTEIDFTDDDVLVLDKAMQGRNHDAQRRAWAVKRMVRNEDDAEKLRALDIVEAWNAVEV